ncbi:MAG TPA: hypothetical protein VF715_07035 [Thermoleophilaceae bacterium]|jgi:hypothetical protein
MTRGPVLEHFEPIVQGSSCLYARGTRLLGAPPWRRGEPLEANAGRLFDRFAEFLEDGAEGGLDGIVFEIAERGYGDDLAQLCETTRVLLTALGERDPAGSAMERDVASPDWWFTLMGRPLFVSAFAPCYPPSSSRYGFGTGSTFFLFLTAESFERRRAPGAATLSDAARQRIRSDHERAGRRYDLSITTGPLEALRYVKPLRLGELPVPWWIAGRGSDHDNA